MIAVDTNILVYAHRRESRHHDAALAEMRALCEGASRWVINLRASVRPVVTYIFVLELVILNITGIWYAWNQGAPFAVAMDNVFSDDEMLILSSIIAFWFGTQAFGKKG